VAGAPVVNEVVLGSVVEVGVAAVTVVVLVVSAPAWGAATTVMPSRAIAPATSSRGRVRLDAPSLRLRRRGVVFIDGLPSCEISRW